MKRRRIQQDEFNSMLFSLTDQGVAFRNRWRGLLSLAAWLILSVLSMVIMLLGSGAKGETHLAIVIGMSFVKYIPLLMVVYSLARVMAARYLDDVYELHDEDLASAFLEEVTFGYGRHKITINEGGISKEDEKSPIILIGGPGEIQVNLDSIALLETVTGQPEVIYPRSEPWKLGRFERIREIGRYDEMGKREYAIVSLRDQFISGLSVKSRTKDGIPLEAHDIKVIFSILRKQTEKDKVQGNAYLIDEQAMRALVYDQLIVTTENSTPSGVTFPWDTTVVPLVISELEELINSHNLGEILTSISQKEMDHASSNDQTIIQMRLEMTGQQMTSDMLKETRAPKFRSRSQITGRFFGKEFREKAAKIGVSIEWIDIGTWQLPAGLTADQIMEKHKKAWELARENSRNRVRIERSKRRHEVAETADLVNNIIIKNYEKSSASPRKLTNKEMENLYAISQEAYAQYRRQLLEQRGSQGQKDPKTVALEILKAFRKELIVGKSLIEIENKAPDEKQADLDRIGKAIQNISHLTDHWVKKP
jgi:cell division septum initiation protein DivIVA